MAKWIVMLKGLNPRVIEAETLYVDSRDGSSTQVLQLRDGGNDIVGAFPSDACAAIFREDTRVDG